MKKKMIVLFMCFCFFVNSYGQYKIVKLDFENTYIRYFDFKNVTEEKQNDSTYYLLIKGRQDTVSIIKIINGCMIWANLCRLEKSNQLLNNIVRTSGKMKHEKKEFFVALTIKKIFSSSDNGGNVQNVACD